MKLMSLEQYQGRRFVAGSAPDTRTLRGWIETGALCGVRRGKRYFVDIEAEQITLGPRSQLMAMNEYIETRFVEGSRPDVRTVRGWIENEQIQGIRYGKLYFINLTSECWATGNTLMDKALAA